MFSQAIAIIAIARYLSHQFLGDLGHTHTLSDALILLFAVNIISMNLHFALLFLLRQYILCLYAFAGSIFNMEYLDLVVVWLTKCVISAYL